MIIQGPYYVAYRSQTEIRQFLVCRCRGRPLRGVLFWRWDLQVYAGMAPADYGVQVGQYLSSPCHASVRKGVTCMWSRHHSVWFPKLVHKVLKFFLAQWQCSEDLLSARRWATAHLT